MAERHGPQGNGQRARPGNKDPNRVEIHRVNDFVFGHVGQVSYQPVDDAGADADADADIGNLALSRTTEQRESSKPHVPLLNGFVLSPFS